MDRSGEGLDPDDHSLTVFSVGHGSRTSEELLALLRWAGVRCVADVRRFPRSRRHPQHDTNALASALESEGVAYQRLGDDLGGFRDDGYEAHVRSEAFAEGIGRLEGLARDTPTAFLCAERWPEHCHRSFIARELEARGWQVRHLVDVGRFWEPEARDEQLTLFD